MEPSSFSKRAKAPANNIAQVAQCLVDGCNADLRVCRDYHRRHKVCELHSKTPKVTIGGREQRFCQQCSRFHGLGEFDEGKRSCRKRLDGHNRRRRKQPQPQVDSGMLFSTGAAGMHTHTRTRLLSFTNPQLLVGSSWAAAGIMKPEHEIPLYSNNQQVKNYYHTDTRPTTFPECVNQLQFQEPNAADHDRDRALSLLSSAPPPPPLPPPPPPELCVNQQVQSKAFGSTAGTSHSSMLHFPVEIMFEEEEEEEEEESTTVPNQTRTFMWE